MYDALSVIQAIGLAEKRGKVYVWVGRPSIMATPEDKPVFLKCVDQLDVVQNATCV